jgi:hypothetical protein
MSAQNRANYTCAAAHKQVNRLDAHLILATSTIDGGKAPLEEGPPAGEACRSYELWSTFEAEAANVYLFFLFSPVFCALLLFPLLFDIFYQNSHTFHSFFLESQCTQGIKSPYTREVLLLTVVFIRLHKDY